MHNQQRQAGAPASGEGGMAEGPWSVRRGMAGPSAAAAGSGLGRSTCAGGSAAGIAWAQAVGGARGGGGGMPPYGAVGDVAPLGGSGGGCSSGPAPKPPPDRFIWYQRLGSPAAPAAPAAAPAAGAGVGARPKPEYCCSSCSLRSSTSACSSSGSPADWRCSASHSTLKEAGLPAAGGARRCRRGGGAAGGARQRARDAAAAARQCLAAPCSA